MRSIIGLAYAAASMAAMFAAVERAGGSSGPATTSEELPQGFNTPVEVSLEALKQATQQAVAMGRSGKEALVHKLGAEGVLRIDALSGQVIPPTEQPDVPEWANGLRIAQLFERHLWYTAAIGSNYAAEHKAPDLYAFEDLSWLGEREDETPAVYIGADLEIGDEFTIMADDEFRMEVVGKVLNVNRSEEQGAESFPGLVKSTMHDIELSLDQHRTTEELADLIQSQTGVDIRKADGTNG